MIRQHAQFYLNGYPVAIDLPPPTQEVMEGVRWGHCDELFTAAFWRVQFELQTRHGRYSKHSLGRSLNEEVAACMLGGYGIPAEMGMLAFHRLRDLNLLNGCSSVKCLESALAAPFESNGKLRRYRFPKQKAVYLAPILQTLTVDSLPQGDLELRNYLLTLNGIGPKTASWVVRNFRNSPDVAIIDVHIFRAGKMAGVFDATDDPAANYFSMEFRFLKFCRAIGVHANVLDAIIWDYMRQIGPTKVHSGAPKKIAAQYAMAI